MHRTKLGAVASSSDSNEPVEPSRCSEDMDESLQLPWLTENSDVDGSEMESSDEVPEVIADSLHDDFQGVHEDWIFSLNSDDPFPPDKISS